MIAKRVQAARDLAAASDDSATVAADPAVLMYQNPALLRQHLLLNGPLSQRQRQSLLSALMASLTPEQFQQTYQAYVASQGARSVHRALSRYYLRLRTPPHRC